MTHLLVGLSAPGCERLGFVSLGGGASEVSDWIGLVASLTSIILEVPRDVTAGKTSSASHTLNITKESAGLTLNSLIH